LRITGRVCALKWSAGFAIEGFQFTVYSEGLMVYSEGVMVYFTMQGLRLTVCGFVGLWFTVYGLGLAVRSSG
jgi:hypothetical protein